MPDPTLDRAAVIHRHSVILTAVDDRSPLSVGNGEFAFNADITGLQTFPAAYESGIPLCTQSTWGWHSFPIPFGLNSADIKYHDYDTYGRPVPYLTSSTGQAPLFNWMRENPHRLHLGRIAFDLRKPDGSPATPADIKATRQELDLWTGTLHSYFEFLGQPVRVRTLAAGELDGIAVSVESPPLAAGKLAVRFDFPYASHEMNAADWSKPTAHTTTLKQLSPTTADLARQLDADTYSVRLAWNAGDLKETASHSFRLASASNSTTLQFLCVFSSKPLPDALPPFAQLDAANTARWENFWATGGAIDLAGSSDRRAPELERRIVLSQYLTAIHCANSFPPQESGLACNTWYGKFHLEMHWWHGAHFALWNRLPLLERSLGYYERILPRAFETAKRQGYAGARWPKMTDPSGQDSPSPIGPLLIWQQPHPIYYAELCYRAAPTQATLNRWLPIVIATADFMADYAHLDTTLGQYDLGPPLKTVSENTEAHTTRNPAFELTYWRFGLRTALDWQKRAGQSPNPKWQAVLEKLSPLPTQAGTFLFQENTPDTYTKWNWEHPALVAPNGMLPPEGCDTAIARATIEKVMSNWQWDRCWGWDFPMAAMAAARNNRPDLAVDALMLASAKNTWSAAGHNYQRPNLPLYLPSNGGLLSAIALMAAGWTGGPKTSAPGFPPGTWSVKHESLNPFL